MRCKLLTVLLLVCLNAAAAPVIQHWQTSRGVDVYFVETHELPIIDLQVVFDAGAVRDPEGLRGLAMLTNGLLSQAAAGMTADEISFEFERLGAQFGTDSGYDSASASLRSLSEQDKLEPALEMLSKVITSPGFTQQDLDRQRNRLLVQIQRSRQNPGSLAEERFQKAIYGEHPYALPTEGDPESLARIVTDDLKAFHDAYYTAANAMVSLVGDVDRRRAEALAEAITRDLPAGTKPETMPPVAPLETGETIRIPHPSTQVHILTGQPGMKYGDPDYFPLYVGNHILGGGGLVSRLFEEVREKRGLSYGASSYFSPRRDKGPFLARVSTREDQAGEALKVVQDTIARFAAEGPTAAELKAAKQNITGGFPLRIDSNDKISGYISVIGFYGLPLDYLDRFNDRIEAVTVEAVRDAFRRRIDVGNFVTVLAGPVGEAGTGQDAGQ